MSTKNPALTPFNFPDSGRTVLIRRVSPYLVYELSKAFPAPQPPLQEVTYPGGVVKQEPNPANPDYQLALTEYQQQYQEKLTNLIIKRGVEVTLSEEDQAEVAELRTFMRDEYHIELNESDKMVFVLNICIGSDKDLEDLVTAITRRSQPTEQAVQEALDGFRG